MVLVGMVGSTFIMQRTCTIPNDNILAGNRFSVNQVRRIETTMLITIGAVGTNPPPFINLSSIIFRNKHISFCPGIVGTVAIMLPGNQVALLITCTVDRPHHLRKTAITGRLNREG